MDKDLKITLIVFGVCILIIDFCFLAEVRAIINHPSVVVFLNFIFIVLNAVISFAFSLGKEK